MYVEDEAEDKDEEKKEEEKKEEEKKKWNGESKLVLVYPLPNRVSHYQNSRANDQKLRMN